MIETCCACKKDFLTEADPYVVRPRHSGAKLYCACMIVGHDQMSGVELLESRIKELETQLAAEMAVVDAVDEHSEGCMTTLSVSAECDCFLKRARARVAERNKGN